MNTPEPSAARLGKIKKRVKDLRTKMPADLREKVAKEAEVKPEDIDKQYIHKIDHNIGLRQAWVRKAISEELHGEDIQNLSKDEQEKIIQRQINRYYRYHLGQPGLRGHVEAVHGTEPSKEMVDYCEANKIASHDEMTNEITEKTTNKLMVKKPRLFTDVNQLPTPAQFSLRSEGALFTREYNLNAIKAQRDLTARILKEQNNLSGDGKAVNPYLAIYIHGKVDTRGHDFEIAAKEKDGMAPLNPLLAFWLSEKIKEKIKQKNIKNANKQPATVNVVTYNAAYSGSPALRRLRKGDNLLGFQGLGENFQALQLECSKFIRYNHTDAISSLMDELIREFNDEFKTPNDYRKLEKYKNQYQQKIKQEKAELFFKKNILFTDNQPENRLGLTKSLREELSLKPDDQVEINGKLFTVGSLTKEEIKSDKTIKLHSKYETEIGDAIKIKKASQETREDLANIKYVLFAADQKPENRVGFSKKMREQAGVEEGDKVEIDGHTFTVGKMPLAEVNKGKHIRLNDSFKGKINEKPVIKKVTGNTEPQGQNEGETTPESQKNNKNLKPTPMSPQNKPSLRDEIKEAVLGGEEMEGLSPDKIQLIIDALGNNKATLKELYDRVGNDLETDVATENDVITRTHALVAEILELERPRIEAKRKELGEKLNQMQKVLLNEPETKKQLQEINKKLRQKNISDDEKTQAEQELSDINQAISEEVFSSPEYHEYKALAELLHKPFSKEVQAEKEKIKKTVVTEKNIQEVEIKNLATPEQIKAAKEYWDKVLNEHGETPTEPETEALFIDGIEIKNPKIKKRYWEFREFMAKRSQEEEAKRVPELEQITSVEQIRNHELKWQDVVNRLGDKPKAGDENLYWKAKERNKPKKSLSEQEKAQYKAFQEFITSAPDVTKKIDEIIGKKTLNLKDKTAEQIQAVVKDNAESALNELSQLYKNQNYTLMLYCLGVNSEEEAYHKITNILLIRNATEARKKSKNKETYSEAKDEATGAPLTMSLEEYTKEKDTHPEIIIEKTNELLYKLFITMKAHEAMDIEEFRNALIEIIKTKGEKEIPVKLLDGHNGKIELPEAKSTYTKLLIMKDNGIQDKEILMFLIALKKKPAFVYDHINDGHGWVLKGNKKTGPGVLENFNRDGAAYLELMQHLDMKKKAFNTFIQKIAPIYEDIRSQLVSKPNITPAELNTKVPDAKFTDEDLAKFKEMMAVPLWMEKIAGAYKYSKYVDESFDIQIPKIQETQGPDTVKKIDVVVVNIEEKLYRIADRIADERLDQEMKELGPQGWTQLWRVDKIGAKWWKRNALEGYRDKYRAEILARLKTDPRFRAELMKLNRNEVRPGGTWAKLKGAWDQSAPAAGGEANLNNELDMIAERFGISFATGDRESYLTTNEELNAATPEYAAIQDAIKTLSINYANGTIDETAFRNQMNTNIIPQIRALQSPPNEEMIAFLEQKSDTTIPLEDRQGLLDKLNAHKAGLIALDLSQNLQINLAIGKARNVDVKTQVKDLGRVDRISRRAIEFLQKNKFLGRFVSPQTVAVMGFGLANIATQIATNNAVRWGVLGGFAAFAIAPAIAPAAIGIGVGCLTGGLMSYFRQNKEQLYLKAQKERRQAINYRPDIDKKGLRPNQAEPSRYERKLETGDRLYKKEDIDVLTTNIKDARSTGNYDNLRESLARAIALNEMSEISRLDLIKYNDEMSIEEQRLKLLRTIAEGKVEFRTMAAARARDPNVDLTTAINNARTDITTNNIELTEANFRRFKRWENIKAAGVGAMIGGSVSALSTLIFSGTEAFTAHSVVPVTPGRVNQADFITALKGQGISQADITSHIKFDAAGRLDPTSIAWLKSTYNLNANDLVSSLPHNDVFNAGAEMSQSQFKAILQSKGLDPAKINFDTNGHLDAASVAYIKSQNVNFTEVLHPHTVVTTGGKMPVADLQRDGFNSISKIHFNDNPSISHANGHVRDELKYLWDGPTKVNGDGTCHFTIQNMVNSPHSHLPPGVVKPPMNEFKVLLEMKGADGNNYWKEFPVAANGSVHIDGKYFDPTRLGNVARGGSILPGLKTTGVAAGFYDKHGTFQILASLVGDKPGPFGRDEVTFLGDILVPGSANYELAKDVTKNYVEEFALATAPIIGAPMKHLEHGETKPAPDRQPTPQPIPEPTPTPTAGQQPASIPTSEPSPEPTPKPSAPTPAPKPTAKTPTSKKVPLNEWISSPEEPEEPSEEEPAAEENPPSPEEIETPAEFQPSPERKKIEEKIDSLNKEISEMETELGTLKYNPDPRREEKLKKDIQKAKAEIAKQEKELDKLLKVEIEDSIKALNEQIDSMEAEISAGTDPGKNAALKEKLDSAHQALNAYEDELERITGIARSRRVPKTLDELQPSPERKKIREKIKSLNSEISEMEKELETLKYNPDPRREEKIKKEIEKAKAAIAELEKRTTGASAPKSAPELLPPDIKPGPEALRILNKPETDPERRKILIDAIRLIGPEVCDFLLLFEENKSPITYPATINDAPVFNNYLDKLYPNENTRKKDLENVRSELKKQHNIDKNEIRLKLTRKEIVNGKLSIIRVTAATINYKIGDIEVRSLNDGTYEAVAKVDLIK